MTESLQQTCILTEGKTKRIWGTKTPGLVVVESKDDLTAGDGAKHDVLVGKGALSTITTCNVFRLLRECGVPVAFEDQLGVDCFSAKECEMIPLEVVVRREAHGSYLKRNPHLKNGHLFPRLVYELYLKTSGKKWQNHVLPCDDPMIVFAEPFINLYVPSKPLWEQEPFLKIPIDEVSAEFGSMHGLALIREFALRTFLVLEKAWQILGHRLVDFKIEFGRFQMESGTVKIMLADVIDGDSWRKLRDGHYSDKQLYRDGKSLTEVAEAFSEAARLSNQFRIPRQQIVLWAGSNKDDITPFVEGIHRLGHSAVEIRSVICSAHKEPVVAYNTLSAAVQDIPDSVVVAYIGKSNGAGPMLAANCTVPVITVPANLREFPQDIWSSLRAPSNVPVMTVSDPKNAVLAALQILAARNPALYANLRYEQEKRMVNTAIF